MILTEILEKNAKAFPHKTALTMRMGYRTVSFTYQEVYDFSLSVACLLEKNGVAKGDRVLLLAPNSPYWICVFWGTLLRGAIIVPLNIQSTARMLKKIAEQTEAKILFKHVRFRQEIPTGLKTHDIELLKEDLYGTDSSSFKETEILENDLAQILYTSGTTGDPKGVMLTHKNIFSNVKTLSRLIPISKDDKFLSILPLSHIFEQVVGFVLPFEKAAQIIYVSSPVLIPDLLKEHRITKMVVVPEFLHIIMTRIYARAREKGKKKIFDTLMQLANNMNLKVLRRLLFYPVHVRLGGKLRTIASGGAALDPELERKWNALGIDLLQGYGLTETSPIISANTYRDHRLGSVGKVLPDVQVKIAPDGEILVKGPNVFQGYFKDQEKTSQAFNEEGWFRTGDDGGLDADGFLYIKGRKKYMIKGSGAQNVYPEDIEFELNNIAGVKDSCVVGLEKPAGRVEIHAVLLGDIENPEHIIEEANTRLASYQQITGWSLWPEEDFPRSATRKVKKEEVIRWLKKKESLSPDLSAKALAKEGEEDKTLLMHLLAEVTDVDVARISGDTKIVPDLNLDSLLRIELTARIEEKFGAVVDESKINPQTLVSDLEEMIKKKEAPKEKLKFKTWPLSWWVILDRMLDQSLFIFPFVKIFVRLKVEGKENLKNLSLPAIFMPNHISHLDSLIILMALPLTTRKRIAYAAAKDVLYGTYKRWSLLAEWLFNAFPFPRREGENIKFGLDYMGRLLDKKWSIVIYPEGEVSRNGELLALKRGTGLVTIEMDVPIVPVKITGTNHIVPYAKLIPKRRGEVSIRFGKPLTFSKRDSYEEAREKIQNALERL
ncbi:AMP-binding protein [Patescibacteria group bacterium]|nr:AMP-binding protein [Patescibacteria group bacterium]